MSKTDREGPVLGLLDDVNVAMLKVEDAIGELDRAASENEREVLRTLLEVRAAQLVGASHAVADALRAGEDHRAVA